MKSSCDFEGKKVTILGLGREGVALARFLSEHGAEVTVSDLKERAELEPQIELLADWPISYVLGGHPLALLETDLLFVSPGVPQEIPIVQEARRRDLPVESETKLFFQLCPAPILGITGSSGKTTTASLVGEMLEVPNGKVWVGGNIGQPLLERVEEIEAEDWVVLELSSFQLQTMTTSPHIGAILNVTPNHLDRHPSMEDYIEAKSNILRYQGPEDYAVLSYDNKTTRRLNDLGSGQVLFFSQEADLKEGAFLRNGEVLVRFQDTVSRICSTDQVKLLGRHNLDNVLAACALGVAAGADQQAMAEAISNFEGVEHRLELVRELNRVRYYNDSIATSPERTVAALRSFDQPILLLAGGRDKDLPMTEMGSLICQKVKHVMLFGEAADLIERAIREAESAAPPGSPGHPVLHHCGDLEKAVGVAARLARPGEIVLLSPACTSFDAYRDFAERGTHFKRLVRDL
ncbi:MAG: UDP-N-acetylmuramoyl-L-alanine--D-glutamate ligase [Anaerolineae bacterium]